MSHPILVTGAAGALAHLSRLWEYFRSRPQTDRPTNTFQTLTGREPQTLEEFFRANIDLFAPVRQSA
jgi:hypothetical protein